MPDKEISPGVFIAGDDNIKQYPMQVQALLEALGHPEALVTDLSTFADFIDEGQEDMEMQVGLDAVLAPLGLNGFCTPDTTLLDAAKLLAQRTNAEQRQADKIDGYDRDDLGESPDY